MSALYIHIPFCERKCFYCSFVVSIGQKHRIDLYLDALAKEASEYKGSDVETVYIGGGTPTLLDESQLARLFEIINENFKFNSGIEFTIESNPEGLDPNKLKFLKNSAVNRISMGIQSFQDKHLKYLGRNHDVALAKQSYQAIKVVGFDNVNVDLMMSFPNQSDEDLRKDLNELRELNPEHVSLYSLMIEENSRFFAKQIKVSEDDAARQYLLVMNFLNDIGLKQYEVSNFARQSKESQHNIHYWVSGNYIGLGVGAHSHKDGRRYWNTSSFMDYLKCVEKDAGFVREDENLSAADRLSEALILGLRMNRGVVLKNLESQFQTSFNQEQLKAIEELIRESFLARNNESVLATDKGRLVLDELALKFI